jgi:hypothetical protein
MAHNALIVNEVSSWLTAPADRVDAPLGPERERMNGEIDALNETAARGDPGVLRAAAF